MQNRFWLVVFLLIILARALQRMRCGLRESRGRRGSYYVSWKECWVVVYSCYSTLRWKVFCMLFQLLSY